MSQTVSFQTGVLAAAILVAGCGSDTVAPLPSKFKMVAVGVLHSCGLVTDGAAYCWGNNQFGQVGDGSRSTRKFPVPVVGTVRFETVTLGGGHTCGVSTTGAAYCWGFNYNGQLGDNSHADRTTPVPVDGNLSFLAVSAGGSYACGIAMDNSAYCWGWNARGQLGDNTNVDRAVPTAVAGGLKFTAISGGSFHTCALTPAGQAYCWGSNDYGELGSGNLTSTTAPVAVTGGITFASVTAGFYHSCGVATDGTGYCWGRNHFGQLGIGLPGQDQMAPYQVAGTRQWGSIVTGAFFTCGVETPSGAAHCWGINASGQLGGNAPDQCASEAGTLYQCAQSPFAVTGGLTFAQISPSTQHTCGLAKDGLAYCWGLDSDGQLGNGQKGQNLFFLEPQKVAGQP